MAYVDRRIGVVVAAAGLAVGLAACAAGPEPDSINRGAVADGEAAAGSIARLRAAAEQELLHPEPASEMSPALRKLVQDASLESIERGTDAWAAANRPMDEVIAEFAARPAFDAGPQPQAPDPAVLVQAMRLYASGRQKAAAGDLAGAAADLEQATKLDPSSAEAWRELGDVQASAGRRLAAIGSYTRSAQCGSTDPRVWWNLGHDAMRSGETARAAVFLARARSISGRSSDPAVEYLIDTELGEALLDAGNLAAGIDLIQRGTSLPLPPPWGTRLRNELVDLLRSRSELRRAAGDAAARIGRIDLALECYDAATEDGLLGPNDLLGRKAAAMVVAGRPAGAALVVVESMQAQPRPVSTEQIALVRSLSTEVTLRTMLGPALDELAGQSTVSGETASKQWTRVRAAARAPDEGRALLREALSAYPEAQDLFGDLMATYPRSDAQGRADEFVRLVERTPRSVALTGRLLVSSLDADAELEAFEKSSSWAAGVIRIPWLIGMGRAEDAYRAAATLDRGRRGTEAATIAAAAVTAKAATGRFETIEEDLAVVRAATGPGDPLLLARALTECQRFIEAYESIPAPGSEEAAAWPGELRLSAASFAVRGGQPAAAEAHALSVLEADPFNEHAYEALAGLYTESSPLADEQKLTRTIQALRQAAPEGRVVTWLTAQEMLGRKLDAQALTLLGQLAGGDEISEPAIAALAMVLERRAALGPQAAAQAEELARGFTQTWPESPVAWAGLARVLTALGRAADAEQMLRERLADRPWPALAGQREALLREALKRPEDAEAAAMARLTPTPRSIEATVSYATELARGHRLDEAARALNEGIPAGAMLTTDQQNRLGAIIAAEFQASDRAGGMPRLKDPSDAVAVAAVFDALAEHGARLAPQMHQARIGVLCLIRPVDVAALRRACDQAARDVPAIAAAANRIAAQELVETAHAPAEATAFLREALRSTAEPSTQLMVAYFAHVAEHGTASDIETLEADIGGVDGELALLKQLLDAERVPAGDTAIRSEFLYQFAGFSTTRGRRDLAKAALARVLEIDPGHAMANNDLGYFYVEDGEHPEKAEQMLVRAYEAEPESHNVADSLGWLRYMQGKLEDERDPATGREVLGAASLITRASEMTGGIDNSTIQDHLGDVLWRTGQKERAVEAWQRAKAMLARDLRGMEEQLQQMPDRDAAARWRRTMVNEAREELAALEAKLAAAAAGREPPVPEMIWKKQ